VITARRWQDGANFVLGIWLFTSPWVLGYSDTIAGWNAYLTGAAIVLFAVIAAYVPNAWEEVINMVIGVWLVLSPFVLGRVPKDVALHTVCVGILATAFAIWAMTNDQRIYKRWQGGEIV